MLASGSLAAFAGMLATPEIIKGFYDRWYHPNNASLVVVGGFDEDKALAKIKAL